MAELTVTDVRVRYGEVRAVDGVSFHLESGTTLALLGPSGCGKTTLLNSIAGFVGIDSGVIAVAGTDVAGLPVRRRGLSMVFQTHALFPHLTVLDNVLFGLRANAGRGRLTERDRADADAAIELVRLSDYRHRYPHELSGGQRQRVALCRALVVKPAVMLLDEPLSSLDAKLRAEMRIELREVQAATGVTMVYVTHDKDEAFALGDLIGVMREGRLVQIGSPEEVCRVPRDRFVAQFLTDANLFPGRVLDPDTDACVVELSSGHPALAGRTVRCRNDHGLAAGTTTVIAVPPGAVQVGVAGAPAALPARVRISQFMGTSVHVVAEAGDCDVLADVDLLDVDPAPVVPADGSTVSLSWRAADAIALPDDGNADVVRRSGSGRTAPVATAVSS